MTLVALISLALGNVFQGSIIPPNLSPADLRVIWAWIAVFQVMKDNELDLRRALNTMSDDQAVAEPELITQIMKMLEPNSKSILAPSVDKAELEEPAPDPFQPR